MAAAAAAYVPPTGMAGLTRETTLAWISRHPNPTAPQREHILRHVFTDLDDLFATCQLLPKQRIAVIRQGITEIDHIPCLGTKVEHIRDVFKGFNTLPDARGGVIFGAMQYTRLHALVSFVQDKQRRGQPINPVDFTAPVMESYIMKARGSIDGTAEIAFTLPDPPKLKESTFMDWEESVLTHLRAKTGTRGIPLSYVIRRDLPDGSTPDDLTDDVERLIYEANRTGEDFDRDNQAVGAYLNGLLAGQPAAAWIRAHRDTNDGLQIMTTLRVHFLGASQVASIVAKARSKRDQAFYKSEGSYTFDRFSTDLKNAFTTLKMYGRPVEPEEQITILLSKIKTNDAAFNAAVATTLLDPTLTSYDTAVAKIIPLVSHFFGNIRETKKRYTAGVSGVTAQDFADQTTNGRLFSKGVDITDFTRRYSDAEWAKLPADVRKAIAAEKAAKGIGGKKKKPGKRKNSYASQRRTIKQLKATIKALTETGTQKPPEDTASGDQSEHVGPGSFGPNGRKKKVSRVRCGKVSPNNIAKVHVPTSDDTLHWLDEDSHADMHCAGKGFIPLSFSDYQCEVTPFLESYAATRNVPIARTATAVEVSSGEIYYLVANVSLWFGDRMETSLFNGNIARDGGTRIATDPSDPNRPLGIEDPRTGTYIPMVRRGNVIGVQSYRPQAEDVLRAIADDSPNVIYLTGPNEFTPTSPHVGATLISPITRFPPDAFPMEPSSSVAGLHTQQVHSRVTPERISQIFGCGTETAKDTIRVTTQLGVRSAVHPLRRRYRTDLLSLRYKRLQTTFYTDTMLYKTKSLGQNVCAQVFTDGTYVTAYPLKSKSEAGQALKLFAEDVGIPNELTSDNAKEMTGGDTEFVKTARRLNIKLKTIEPHTARQNKAERVIGELRRRCKDIHRRKGVKQRLWDYTLVWCTEIMSRTYNRKLGRTGIEHITGETPDISEWADFGFYDRVWYWDAPGMDDNPKPGRWLGVSHRVGSALCYYIITATGKVISRTSVQHATDIELQTDAVKQRFQALDQSLSDVINDDNFQIQQPNMLYEEDIASGLEEPPEPVEEDSLIGDIEESDTFDQYIGAQLYFDTGPEGGPRRGRVIKRAKGDDGRPIGRGHGNPMLDTRRYEVEIEGIPHEFSANVIAENLYSQVDSEGREELLFQSIVDHKTDATAIRQSDGFCTTRSGQQRPKITTKGWFLKVEWKDGTTSWLPLSEVKNSNPIELAEYAIMSKIENEPAFRWWVPTTLRKRDKMVSKVKSKYWRTEQKFGIKLPHSVEEALRFDKETGTDYWQRAIEKEMARVRVAFEKWEGGETVDEARNKLVGYQFVDTHMVFDIRIDGLVRKARLVAGGHTTSSPSSITYSSVVSRDSVRIAFLVAALNDLTLVAADIGNAYLNAPNKEKIYTVAGPEFGEDQGTVYLVTRALYGLKSAGAAWRSFFAQVLIDLRFRPTRGDPDVYIREATRPNGQRYYEWMLTYVDDILLMSHDPKPTVEALQKQFRLKEDSLGAPNRYLGASIKIFTDASGYESWAISSDDYVKHAVANVEHDLETQGTKLKGKAHRPFPKEYRPELDATPLLNEEDIAKYQGYMGIFRWMIEIGRIDILTEVSLLSSHQAAPREGHLEACYHIFAYLRKNKHMALVMHPSRVNMREDRFKVADWVDFYGDETEEIPYDAPTPLGTSVKITAWVDANHAGNMVTRRSHTGYLFYLNNAPILFYSKKQNTVEASTFGSEFIAARTAVEVNEGLRFKLRMFGIPIEGPTDIMCDNNSVVNSAQRPESVLSKKHLAICYHRVRESVARGACRFGKIETELNLADLFSKVLPEPSRHRLLNGIVWRESYGLREVEKDDKLNKGTSEE